MSSKSRWFGLMYLKQEKVFWDAKAKTIFHDKTTKSTRSMKYDKENTSFGNFFWNIALNHECHRIEFHFMSLCTKDIQFGVALSKYEIRYVFCNFFHIRIYSRQGMGNWEHFFLFPQCCDEYDENESRGTEMKWIFHTTT